MAHVRTPPLPAPDDLAEVARGLSTITEVAKHYGVSAQPAARWLRAAGISMKEIRKAREAANPSPYRAVNTYLHEDAIARLGRLQEKHDRAIARATGRRVCLSTTIEWLALRAERRA